MGIVVSLWSLNGPSTVMLPSCRCVTQRHSHVPCAGEIRTQSPRSCPTFAELFASKTGLWNVNRSPVVSPLAPVSTTVSVFACSMT